MDGDGVAGHARGGELGDVDGPQIQAISAAAAGAYEVARELRRDLAADLVAAGADRGSEPRAERRGVPPRRVRVATAAPATFFAVPRQPACAAPTAPGAASRIETQSAV